MTSTAWVSDVSGQLAAASEAQQHFTQHWPQAFDTVNYSARCRQLCELGGDCCGFIPLPGHRLGLFIADASGKGLPAALSIAGVQSSLRTAFAFAGCDLAAVINVVNREVHAWSEAGKFATLFFGVFDEATSTLRYVNAGHNPALVVRQDGSTPSLAATGLPVGMFADSTYEEVEVQLSRGDLLIAYTDGITEATDPAGEELGVERLRWAATDNPGQDAEGVVQAIFKTVDKFSRGRQDDDATVLVLQAAAPLGKYW
jgi:phosphoserine phosphatase RsbU/P